MPSFITFHKRTQRIIALLAAIAAILGMAVNHHIATGYNKKIYNDPAKIPASRVGLVLGTSKLVHGRPNLYYQARIEATFTLYRAGKIKKILASGDNSKKNHNEPTDMKNDLVRLGVDPNDVYLDYAGFRTLDSIARAKQVFGLSSFTVISQPFHCQRALFIARHQGVDAVGFAARDIKHASRFLLDLREFAARVKAGLDIWVLNTGPKFLGKPVVIAQQQRRAAARGNIPCAEKRTAQPAADSTAGGAREVTATNVARTKAAGHGKTPGTVASPRSTTG